MNRFENWFCASSLWRFFTERKLLPWILSGYPLGDHVLVGTGAKPFLFFTVLAEAVR